MKTIISRGFDAAIAAHGADPSRHGKVFAPGSAHDLGRTPSPLRVFVFDVGKGDCIVLSAGSSSVMIDTGYESTAASVVVRLRAEGIGRLSAMIVTHYDRDHVDGIRSIGGAMGVDAIYLPGYVGSDKNYRSCVSATASLGVPTIRVTRELTLNLAQARLTVFPSVVTYVAGSGKVEGNDNDMSLVATLAHGRDSYLFAGDLEEEGIRAYLAAGHGSFDVLKMPHHGEYSPGISELLDDVRPKIAAITDSVSDAADKKTLKLLKSAGVRTYRTSVDGTIIIDSDGSGTYSVSSASDMSS